MNLNYNVMYILEKNKTFHVVNVIEWGRGTQAVQTSETSWYAVLEGKLAIGYHFHDVMYI